MVSRSNELRRNRLPMIHRARGYRLYGTDGRRYVDFYQDGGRALLGHRPAGWTWILKSTGNRGLFAPYPSRFAGKARRAALSLFSWVGDAHVFPDLHTALAALSRFEAKEAKAGAGVGGAPSYRPADVLTASQEELEDPLTIPLLRPFGPGWAPANAEISSSEREKTERAYSGAWGKWLLPLIPIPGEFGAVVLLELTGGDQERGREPECYGELAGEGDISPLSEDLMLRAVSDLSRYMDEADPERWRLFDLPGFVRRGPYLLYCPRNGEAEEEGEAGEKCGARSSLDSSEVREYNNLFEAMLERGVLLPPNPADPAIIPGEYSDGEVQPLIRESRRRYADR